MKTSEEIKAIEEEMKIKELNDELNKINI